MAATKREIAMKLPLALFAIFLVSTAAIAADTKPAAKPKPCPKGQVATTSKITGEQHCFAMQVMTTPGQAVPVETAAKPKPKPKPN
jgi:hypothetical protein